jgi:oleandomycin transport system ATP-binding protein
VIPTRHILFTVQVQATPGDRLEGRPAARRPAHGAGASKKEVAMAVMIQAEGLAKSFGTTRALDGVDLEVAAGTVLGLLGPNGAGKTTAVRILTTLLAPTSGKATVGGYDVVRQPHQVRQRIGLAGQYAAVDEYLSGTENLVMLGRLLGLGRADAGRRAAELLDRFELADAAGRTVKTYSGGMRRRLDLAASLVGRPPVLFLDEPTTGLDPRSRNGLWAVIRELVAEETTVLLTTQYMEEADQLAHHIAVIDHGQVIATGTPDELKAKIGGQVLEVRPANPAEVNRGAELLVELTGNQATIDRDIRLISVPMPDPAWLPVAVRRLDEAGIIVVDLALRRPSLDEVFLTLTGRPAEAEPLQDGAGHERSAA